MRTCKGIEREHENDESSASSTESAFQKANAQAGRCPAGPLGPSRRGRR